MPTSEPAQLTSRERDLLAAYRARDLSVRELLVSFGATRCELDGLLSRVREPFRRPASARPGRNLLRRGRVELPAVGGPPNRLLLERRLMRLLSERVAELEARSGPGRSADPEAVDKALALSVRTLAALRRGAETEGDDDGHDIAADEQACRPLRSLAELRDELYGHLQRLSEEASAAGPGGAGAAEIGGGGMAAPLADLLPPEPAPSGDGRRA